MSHFSQIKTKMTNERAIVAALEEMGYEVQVHQIAMTMPSSFHHRLINEVREANIVISLKQEKMYQGTVRRSQLGFLLGEDGVYEAIADHWFNEAEAVLNRLPMAYAKNVVMQKAEELGDDYTVSDRVENGQLMGYTITVDKTPQLAIGQSSITSNQLFAGGSY